MSKFVDERVVEMSFDNKRFESNVKTSMGTINKLKDSLDFSGTSKNINRELSGINANGITTALLGARNSFTAFEIASITAIANIANRVVDLGIKMAASLSTDQISAGWGKFGQTAISEATLLAQGFEQADVTETLEKLLWYSDETSYSFTDMVDNMSKFTASGQGLEESSRAMMGIANWAALSGQNAGVASRAMYQLSQAMSTGAVRLMDYKSIQTANMDTKEFRETVLSTAVALGQLTQNVDGTYTTMTGKTFNTGQFTTELDELWFTSEVLMKSLDKYSSGSEKLYEKISDDSSINTASQAIEKYGDELGEFELKAFLAAQEARTFKDAIVAVKDAVASGWMNIFTNIFGSVAEAKVLWSDLANSLYDVFMDGMWKKIDILSIWSENNGRDDLFANTEENTGAFWNLFNALVAIKDLIGGAWQKVFGFSDLEEYDGQINDIATKLKTFTENLKEWSKGLIMSSETTEILTNVLTGLFSILKIVGKTAIAVAKGFSPIIEVLKQALGYLLGALGIVGKEITRFADSTTMFGAITSNMQNFFNAIINFVKSLGLLKGITIFVDSFRKSLSKTMGTTNNYAKAGGLFKSIIDSMAKAFLWFGDILTKYVVPVLPRVFELLGAGFGWIIGSISNLVSLFGKLIKRFREWASTSVIFQNGIKFMKDVLTSLGKVFKKVLVNITGFFDSFGKVNMKPVDEFNEDVEEKFSPLKTFFEGLSNLFKGLWGVAKLIIPALGALFTFLGKVLTTLSDKIKSVFTNDAGKIDFQKIFTVSFWAVVVVGIVRFADMLRSITKVFRDAFDGVFDYFNSKAMMQYMEAIKTMAISILLMVGALLILGMMDTGALVKSMTAMGILIGFMVGVMLLMKGLLNVTTTAGSKGLFKAKDYMETRFAISELGIAFLGIGLAILLLATSLKKIASIEMGQLLVGLGAIALLMFMLTKVTKSVTDHDKQTNKAVKAMVKMAISISLLVVPLNRIGKIDVMTGIKGVIGIGVLMGLLTAYSRFSKPIEKSQKPINSMLMTALALTLLIVPLKVIGAMDWIPLGKSFAAIAALFAILVIVSKSMKLEDVDRLKNISSELIKVGFALSLFGLSLLTIGSIKWTKIVTALGALAGVLLVLTIFNKILGKKLTKPRVENMNKIVWSLMPLSIGLLTFGIAVRAIGGIEWTKIGTALGALASVFLVLVIFNKILGKQLTKPRVQNMNKMVWSLIPLSIGLLTFGIAVRAIGDIKWTKILTALGALSLVLLVLAGISILLKKVGASNWTLIALAGALIILSVGMLVFSVALLALGSLPLPTIGKGLLAIVGVFAVLAIVGILLKPLIPILLSLALVFVLFAAGVFLLSAALTMLAAITAVSAAAFAAGLIAMATAFIVAMPVISKALEVLAKGIANFFKVLMIEMIKAFKTILISLKDLGPYIADALRAIIEPLLDLMLDMLPKIIKIVDALLFGIINYLIYSTPMLVAKLFVLVITLFNALGDTFRERGSELGEATRNLVTGIFTGLWDAIFAFFGLSHIAGKVKQIGADLLSTIGDGIVSAWGTLKSTVSTTVSKMPEWFNDGFSTFKQIGKNIIDGIIDGVESLWGTIKKKFEDLAKALPKWVKDILGIKSPSTIFKDIGGDMIQGLINGITGLWDSIKKEVEKLGNALPGWMKKMLGINSPSRVFAEIGEYIDMGLVKGIDDNSGDVYDSVYDLADEAVDGAKASGLAGVLNGLIDTLNGDFDNEIVIKPVLDLSEIQNGKARLSSMMSDINSYDISGSNSIASRTRDEFNRDYKKLSDVTKGSSKQEAATSEVINNTFNITGANAKEIADEVSRVLQIQVDRRKAKWAL